MVSKDAGEKAKLIIDGMRRDARSAALEDAARVCLVKVKRPPGHNGQWEGYGAFEDWMTGPECAASIRALKEAPCSS